MRIYACNASALTRRNPNHSRSPGVSPERQVRTRGPNFAGLGYSATDKNLDRLDNSQIIVERQTPVKKLVLPWFSWTIVPCPAQFAEKTWKQICTLRQRQSETLRNGRYDFSDSLSAAIPEPMPVVVDHPAVVVPRVDFQECQRKPHSVSKDRLTENARRGVQCSSAPRRKGRSRSPCLENSGSASSQ